MNAMTVVGNSRVQVNSTVTIARSILSQQMTRSTKHCNVVESSRQLIELRCTKGRRFLADPWGIVTTVFVSIFASGNFGLTVFEISRVL